MAHCIGWSRWGVAVAALVGSGCQAAQGPYAGGYPAAAPYPVYDYSAVTPAAGAPRPVAAAQPPEMPYQSPAYQALEGTAMQLKERLERVEKAMLRLDRRMQLVERNELSRMDGRSAQAVGPVTQVGASEGDVSEAMKALGLDDAASYRPVAGGEPITSALQAAPGLSSPVLSGAVAPHAGVQVASRSGLPSLADPARVSERRLQAGQNDVAIWTVRYTEGKVWPDRSQLPSSRDVVDVLRENGKANIYARGKNASAVEFRDRVKALSRYLSKVSSLDTVPIAAMAAPHLDNDTIEIVITH